MKYKFGQGWYHNEDEYHPDHDLPYAKYTLPLSAFCDLRRNVGVYKVVFDALSSFTQGDKTLFWNNFSIKTHHGSPFHIMRSRVSMIDDPKSEWRLIVRLCPHTDGGVVEVLIVSPVRDYKTINAKVREILDAAERNRM